MALPKEIGDAAQDGDRDRVMAWLNAGGSINDVDEDGYTLLHCCVCGDRDSAVIGDEHVALVRQLIALGADVNIPTTNSVFGDGYGSYTALHEVSRKYGIRHPQIRHIQKVHESPPPRRPSRPRPRAARQIVDRAPCPELPRAARRQRRVLAYSLVLARNELTTIKLTSYRRRRRTTPRRSPSARSL